MNTRIFTCIVIFISLVISAPSYAGSELQREWKLSKIYVKGMKVQQGTTLTFDKGRYYMFAGCNRFFGGYKKIDTDGKIKINHGASTKKLCPGNYENQFSKVLFSADRYEIKHNHLILYSNDKKIVKFGK